MYECFPCTNRCVPCVCLAECQKGELALRELEVLMAVNHLWVPGTDPGFSVDKRVVLTAEPTVPCQYVLITQGNTLDTIFKNWLHAHAVT